LQEAKASSEVENIITTNLYVGIVQCIKQNNASIPNTSGTILSNTQGKVIYTPPGGEQDIREKLANLEKFINDDEPIYQLEIPENKK